MDQSELLTLICANVQQYLRQQISEDVHFGNTGEPDLELIHKVGNLFDDIARNIQVSGLFEDPEVVNGFIENIQLPIQ